jgi:hypothetical protein
MWHGMRKRVYPTGQATYYYQAALRQFPAHEFGHLTTVNRWPPRAHNAEAWRVQDAGVPANIKHRGWIINLQQRLRISRLDAVQHPAADAPDGGDLFFRAPEGLLLEDCLSRGAGRLQASRAVRLA